MFGLMRILVFLFGVLFFASCKTPVKDGNLETINVAVNKLENDKVAFNNYNYIKLETTDDCLLENVVKAKITDKYIYLLSSYGGNIYKFTRQGSFIWKLSKGEGVGELVFPTDFYLDVANGCLWVLDNYRVAKKYSAEGKFIGEDKLETLSFLFEKADDEYMLFDPNLTKSSSHYLKILKNAELTFSGLPIKENTKVVSFMPSNVFVKAASENEYYIQHMLSDTIYHYQADIHEINPVFYIDSEGKSVNSRDIKFLEPHSFQQICKKENLISGFAGLSYLNEKLYMMMYYNDKLWYIIYDMNKKTTVTTNRLCQGMPNSSRCVGRDKDFIVYSYRPEEFYEKKDELGDKAMTLLNEVKEDDNPILVLYN